MNSQRCHVGASPAKSMAMYVVKRNGKTQASSHHDVVTGLDMQFINPVLITQKVVEGFYQGITTAEVDRLAAETCAYMSQKHPDFSTLAARIAGRPAALLAEAPADAAHGTEMESMGTGIGDIISIGMSCGSTSIFWTMVRSPFTFLGSWPGLASSFGCQLLGLGTRLLPGELLAIWFSAFNFSRLECCRGASSRRSWCRSFVIVATGALETMR
eukprot:g24655.t1